MILKSNIILKYIGAIIQPNSRDFFEFQIDPPRIPIRASVPSISKKDQISGAFRMEGNGPTGWTTIDFEPL